ncbi:MAG TPA: hypothetical protein VMC09_05705 [Anaerolineales bacterium]|nr:hypothetical protein [Anaerolineales bacterium]
MDIPAIGEARGIFEIFVPGTFLLLNLGFVLYMFPYTDSEIKSLISAGASNPAIALIIAVSFGYLIGILLRLFRPEFPDKLSARWLRIFARREDPRESRIWSTEEFPYITWIGESCSLFLSKDAQDFYDKTWKLRKMAGQNKQFFNFAKVVIISNDTQAAAEVYAAEALTRYISGMFYALSFAFLLLLATIVLSYLVSGQLLGGLIFIVSAYLFAILIILTRFRFIRIKEVEVVFAASYKNKEHFEGKKTRNTDTSTNKG